MAAPFYGLTASQVSDIGRGLWQAWRAIGGRLLREHGIQSVPAIIAVEHAMDAARDFGGQFSPGSLEFIEDQTSFANLEVARAAGYFKADIVGKA
jgi:hypothetical protein